MTDTEDWQKAPEQIFSSRLSIALIDGHRFSQNCLISALGNDLILDGICFDSPDEMFAEYIHADIIIFNSHGTSLADSTLINQIGRIVEAFTTTPLVIMSDAQNAVHASSIRQLLKSGARGVIAMRTTSLSLVVAALLFVKAGGILTPVDISAGDGPEPPPPISSASPDDRFTARQLVVLDHVVRGDSNKIIAHELQMSESTVKVHVRNIMLRLGATNRTQAVHIYKMLFTPEEII